MGPNQNSSNQPQTPITPAINTAVDTKPVAPSMPQGTTPTSPEKKEGGVGALIGSIIIVIIIILGGLYFWGKALEKKNAAPTNETSVIDTTSGDAKTTLALPPSESLSAVDEIAQIEAALSDLESMNSNSDLAVLGE